MKLYNHILLFRDSLTKRYGQVDISYQVDRRYDSSVLLKINTPQIDENDIIDELLGLLELLNKEGFGLVLLDDNTLLTFDPQLDTIEMSLCDSVLHNNMCIVAADMISICPIPTDKDNCKHYQSDDELNCKLFSWKDTMYSLAA